MLLARTSARGSGVIPGSTAPFLLLLQGQLRFVSGMKMVDLIVLLWAVFPTKLLTCISKRVMWAHGKRRLERGWQKRLAKGWQTPSNFAIPETLV